MPPFPSRLVDTTCVVSYFSSFPVKNCEYDALPTIQKALQSTIYSCTTPGTKAQRKAEYRHTNPAGNLFGLCFSLCEADRLGYAVQFIEFLCIVDDVMEDLPFKEACTEHDFLREALSDGNYQDEYEGVGPIGKSRRFLRDIRTELVKENDPSSLMLLETLDMSLEHRDSLDVEFLTLEDYIPYRKMNFDYEFVCQLLRWAMKIPMRLSPEEELLVRKYEHSIGVIVGLTNDYFSWEMERIQATDRLRNAVAVLIKEHSIPESQAKVMLKDYIMMEEKKVLELMHEFESNKEDFEQTTRYLSALELFAAGYSFWCSTCPRYHRIQKEEDFK
ncbi:terpenoid synthase [Gymnopus androsaceus JB14]|uniref:Terpenoid synthase n=1 Tax=Gymnopus androsaceus JB14 TaxID=1447944 RepID=A0A6A4I9R5_9AGAR|nr:terpenoid synthase [Gymnopus androsaceus JB14]